MCGIVMGVVKDDADKGMLRLARRDLDRAMCAMDSRGGDSWGLSAGTEQCRVELRGLGTYQSGGTIPILSAGSIMVGHTRYATQGEVHLGNAHPFSHMSYSVAHNGAFRAPIPYDAWADCDSYRLTGEVARAIDSRRDVALDHGGYGTVIASDGYAAHVWRSGGQCHAVLRPWGLLVTSVAVPDMAGSVVTIPDDECAYQVTAVGGVWKGPRITLDKTPTRWELGLGRSKGRGVYAGSLAASYELCVGCNRATHDGWLCRMCEGLDGAL